MLLLCLVLVAGTRLWSAGSGTGAKKPPFRNDNIISSMAFTPYEEIPPKNRGGPASIMGPTVCNGRRDHSPPRLLLLWFQIRLDLLLSADTNTTEHEISLCSCCLYNHLPCRMSRRRYNRQSLCCCEKAVVPALLLFRLLRSLPHNLLHSPFRNRPGKCVLHTRTARGPTPPVRRLSIYATP